MSFKDQYDASHYPLFLERTEVAVLTFAHAVSYEASTTTNHANRIALAKAVANSVGNYTQIFAGAICTDATITIDCTDAELSAGVASNWDLIAGQS